MLISVKLISVALSTCSPAPPRSKAIEPSVRRLFRSPLVNITYFGGTPGPTPCYRFPIRAQCFARIFGYPCAPALEQVIIRYISIVMKNMFDKVKILCIIKI
jgi:hypothetical protein